MKDKERNYKIDLLKIYSMFLVVLLHAIGYGLRNYEINSITNIVVSFIKGFASVGVNCFVLITGYFLSGKSKILYINDLKKAYCRLVPLWIQIAFYSIVIYIISQLLNRGG